MGFIDFLRDSFHEATSQSLRELFSFNGAFVPSVLTIIVSEIGDKTFFIATLMSMKYSAWTVFFGAAGALWVMTVLSALGGTAVPLLIDKKYTKWVSASLFFYFGVTQLYTAYYMDGSEVNEELIEVQEELGICLKEDVPDLEPDSVELGESARSVHITAAVSPSKPTKGPVVADPTNRMDRIKRTINYIFARCMNPILLQSFTWTFLAEWGDRSQIATIALASNHNWILVSLGAIIGHSLCTGLACFCGGLISESVSERLVGFVAGGLFLLFGVIDLLLDDF